MNDVAPIATNGLTPRALLPLPGPQGRESLGLGDCDGGLLYAPSNVHVVERALRQRAEICVR